MLSTLSAVLPIFLIACLGYIATRAGLISQYGTQGLASFVFNLGLPAFLFYSMATLTLPAQFPAKFLFFYYLSILLVFCLALVTSKKIFLFSHKESVIGALGACYANYTLVGLPVLFSVFGEASTLPAFLIISLHGAIFLTLATLVIEYDAKGSVSVLQTTFNTLSNALKNPIVASLLVGVLYNMSGFGFFSPLADMFAHITHAVIPLSLFLIGAQMASFRLRGRIAPAIYLASLKNLLHPAIVWIIFSFIDGIDPFWEKIAICMAAVPVGINMLMFANQKQTSIDLASTTIFISIASSMVTLSFVLWLINAT